MNAFSIRISPYFVKLVAGTLMAGLSLSAMAAHTPSSTASGPISPLPNANSFSVQERVYYGDPSGHMTLHETLQIRVAKPTRFWIEDTLAKPTGTETPSVYASNGDTQDEYDGDTNQYVRGPALKSGQTPEQTITFLYNIGTLSALLAPNPDQWTWTRTTLSGKSAWLHTKALPAFHSGGVTFNASYLYWADARTGLLSRADIIMVRTGQTGPPQKTVIEKLFTHWAINPAFTAADFAWTPPVGAKVYTAPVQPVLLKVGTPAPNFTATTPDGKSVQLSDLHGKTVILDFWATWCGPCQASMPHLQKVYQQVKDQNVSVLAVCVFDQNAAYQKWVQAKQGTYTFPTAYDPAGTDSAASIAGHLYGVSGIPTQYVIDTNGKIAAVNVGYSDGDHQLEDALAKLGISVTK